MDDKDMLSPWDNLSDVEKAIKVAKKLLGPPKISGGTYAQVFAMEDLSMCDPVVIDENNNAKKWSGKEIPNGIAIGTLTKGNYGWTQLKS